MGLSTVERMEIYQPGDQLATLSAEGKCRIWRITADGEIEPHPHYPTTED
jgi:hypothetical protein